MKAALAENAEKIDDLIRQLEYKAQWNVTVSVFRKT